MRKKPDFNSFFTAAYIDSFQTDKSNFRSGFHMRSTTSNPGKTFYLPKSSLTHEIREPCFDRQIIFYDFIVLVQYTVEKRRYISVTEKVYSGFGLGNVRSYFFQAQTSSDELQYQLRSKMQSHQTISARPINFHVHVGAGSNAM